MTMLKSVQELRDWIDAQEQRHRPGVGNRCSCGWTWEQFLGAEPIDLASHREATILSDLGDVLPSNTWVEGGPQPWRALVEDLYDCIDRIHEEQDRRT